ncbi:MAG TPA: tetratricopeptide repeat protein [Longimicrobium sp.]|jgi:predicted ATPase/class 3 adenylate cyclase
MQPEPGAAGPRGTVTFLFTDMEGSTRLLQQIGAAYPAVLEEQRRLAMGACERHGGRLVDTAGDGLFVAFERARDALAAAIEAQRALLSHPWPDGAAVRVRMGLHTGEPVASGSGYTGLDVHRAARIMSAAHGGQVVLSEATRQLAAGDLPGVELVDLGEHALKDLPRPERLYQVRAEGLPAAFPPLRTAGAPGVSLPGRALPLIGRDEELAAVSGLLRRDDVRLLTLTGTGGTGKTSLAIEAAARCIPHFPGGVAFVALAPIAEPPLVFAAVAQTLAVSPRAGQEPLDAVVEQLRERRLLLVLDNFEHVLGAATGVARLVASCPGVKALVTSRFALRLSMEREYPVAPLPTPGAAAGGNAALLRAYPSVQLFAERAAAVKPGFGLDDESTVAVAEICHRLDGLPLAIELAAARVKLFSPRALLARLDRRLELLSGGPRDLPDRHRTLRQAIGWSYDLLDAGEQATFRRLAVFAGGFSLEAAEAVSSAAGGPVLPALEAVSALVDKSLLRQEEPGEDDEPRFRMLETVREFALERLAAAGEEASTRAAHADVTTALAERAAPELAGAGQPLWLPRLEREHDDLRAALDWAVRAGDAARALRLGAALCRFWLIRGFHTEGRRRLRAVLALPHAAADEPLRARVLSGAAILAYEQGDLGEGTTLLEEVLAHHRAAGDARGVAETLNHMGWVAFYTGDLERVRTLTEEALALHERRGDTRGIALSLTNLGAAALQGGDVGRALQLYGRALELRRELNEGRSIAYGSLNLSLALIRAGELDRAEALTRDAERTLRALGDKQLLGYACFCLAEAALERGRPADAVPPLEEAAVLGREVMQGSTFGLALAGLAEALALTGEPARAAELARESVELHESTGTHVWLVLSLRVQGDVLRLAGDRSGAREAYLRALRIAVPHGIGFYVPDCLAGLAALASDAAEHALALRLAAASRALRDLAGRPPSPRGPDLDRIEAAAAQALGEPAAERARAEGAGLAPERLDEILAQVSAGSD